jgi:hypothetical protein
MEINKKLLREYLQTTYKIADHISFSPEVPSLELKTLVMDSDWALIISDNPRSTISSCDVNLNNRVKLKTILDKTSLPAFYTYSISEGWPQEMGYLIVGISEEEAIKIAMEFNQDAIILGKGENSKIHWISYNKL